MATRKPAKPSKPIEDMSKDELRAHLQEVNGYLQDRAEAARVRGVAFRVKQKEKRIIRFSVFISEDLKEEVAQAVRDIQARHRPAVPPSAPAFDLVPLGVGS